MKKTLYLIILIVLAYASEQLSGTISLDSTSSEKKSSLQTAYAQQRSDIQIQHSGKVIKILPDDLKGSKHQRFILKSAQLSILVAHNIDLAPRIKNLKVGDTVEFYGEYEWNKKGGIIHWTHHDPAGRHIGGWLKHRGKTYQ